MKTYVFTNRVYPPVRGATGELLKELAEGLAGADTRVVVVTSRGGQGTKGPRDSRSVAKTGRCSDQRTKGRRDHESESRCQLLRTEPKTKSQIPPRQTARVPQLRDEGKPKDDETEVINGVEVIRVGTVPFTRASHWRRALSYLVLYPQLMWQVWKLGRVDAVISMTDPPLQVVAVTLAACRAKKRIHWAQDVYPELAEELGVIVRGGLVARVLRAVSTWALRRQDEVVAVGRCMRERLIARGIDAGKIAVIPNWSPVSAVSDDEAAAIRQRLGWNGKFIVLYSGNLGLAHDFETPVEAARLLAGTNVHLVFAGEGPRESELRKATNDSPQISFLPPQAKEELGAFLAAADVHLVTVRAGLEGLVVPSKAYGILAAGRPIIYLGPAGSEMARVLGETGAGVIIGNGEADKLAEIWLNLSRDEETIRLMGSMAQKASADYTLSAAKRKWSELFENS